MTHSGNVPYCWYVSSRMTCSYTEIPLQSWGRGGEGEEMKDFRVSF